ncbi:MAG: hypothetical protein DI535_21060 [Citrobacter freundii]|nr:MAG: hypothetical protein DI535_21060 [Citrobacter freundii]
MGYHIFFYAAPLDELDAAIGSSNNDLFEETQETEAFEGYSSQDIPGYTSTKDALEQMIFNKPYDKKSAHAYWYALIALCDSVGEQLDSTHEISLSYETDLINQYLKSDFGIDLKIEEVLLNERPVSNLPRVQDFPMHGVLYKADLLELKEKFKNIEISDEQLDELLEEDDEKEMAYDSIRQIKANVLFCLENDLELLAFCH